MTSLLRHALLAATVVAATACGGPSDTTEDPVFEPWHLDALAPEDGFSLRTPEVDIPSGSDLQDCYFVTVPDLNNGQDFWVDQITTAINPGSHHMNVFRVKTIVNLDGEPGSVPGELGQPVRADGPEDECFKSANWADWPLVANSQHATVENPYTDWKLPEGVAHRFSPGEKLMLQTHYVNATVQTTPFKAKVGVNFYRSKLQTPVELGTLFATQQSIRVCQTNPTPSFSGVCSFPTSATITAVNGHFHARGERFQVFNWDGVTTTQPPEAMRVYESTTWDDPPMDQNVETRLPQAAQVPANGGVWWTCDYQWREPNVGCDVVNERDKEHEGDCCYTFGAGVEAAEHCNVFLYYYPKEQDIICY